MAISNPLRHLNPFLSGNARVTSHLSAAERLIELDLDRLEREAIVTETISPHKRGRVRFQGSWWPARCLQDITISPNAVVYVVGRQNITLLVESASQSADKASSDPVLPVSPFFPMF